MSSSQSQSHSSSSLKNAPICLCESIAHLKVSNTSRNPRRPFFTCPKYNKEGKPYCNYFVWADFEEGNESSVAKKIELQQREEELKKREVEFQTREKELQYAREEIQKREKDIQNRVLVLLNDREELQSQIKDISHARMLLCVYWGLSILISYCLLRSSLC